VLGGLFCNLDILYRGLGIDKLQFLILKKNKFFAAVILFNCWIRIRIDLLPIPLDPDPEKMNTDPKHCIIRALKKIEISILDPDL
jgi:hypothetical protein